MTYRERYKQRYPEEDASRVHLILCPDMRVHNTPGFYCPCTGCGPYPNSCRDCWDRDIPGAEAEPPKSEPSPTPEKPVNGEATARILVEVIGDTIHMEADGDMEHLIFSVLDAVHVTAKDVYDSAESKLAAEKIIYGFQKVFNPLFGEA